VSIAWTIPVDAAGPLSIASSYVPELAVDAAQLRDDNDADTTRILLPDLEITGLRVLHDDHDSAVVQFTVHNSGSAPSQPARVEVRSEWRGGEKEHEFAVPALAPGNQQSYSINVNVPNGIALGDHDIHAIIVPAVGEEHHFGLNNVGLASLSAGSDLVFDSQSLTATLSQNDQTIQVQGRVRNNGYVSTMTPTTLQIVGGPLVGLGAVPPLFTIDIPVLLPGETHDFAVQITTAMVNPLPETLFLRVDPGNVVDERDMLNNLAVINVVGEPQDPTAIENEEEPTPPTMDHSFFLPLVTK